MILLQLPLVHLLYLKFLHVLFLEQNHRQCLLQPEYIIYYFYELLIEVSCEKGGVVGPVNFADAKIDVLSQFYNARPATIYGGSNEIQRNIISKMVLGLPN